jgi:prevent-host-death family protein
VEQIGSEQARKRLPELLERAHRGESTIITRRGTPYAALVPLSDLREGELDFLALRGTGKDIWSLEPAVEISKLRDEWE